MSQGAVGSAGHDAGEGVPNPVCCNDRTLPPPPAIGELIDPAEPHPAEPGAPDDAPRALGIDSLGTG